MEIKVLGPGCSKCQKTAELVEAAVKESGLDVTIEKVTDLMEIAGHGVLGTPAVIVNGDVKCVGKIPGKDEIIKWINEI